MSIYLPRWRQLLSEEESALARCDTQCELENTWFAHCDHHPDGSRERRHLLEVYAARLKVVKANDQTRAKVLRWARAS